MKLRMAASPGHFIARNVLSFAVLALSVPLLHWILDDHVTLHRLEIYFLFSLVYSICIGTLLSTAVPPVWIRSARFFGYMKWFARGATVCIGTTVGCLIANTILLAVVRGNYSFRAEFWGSLKIALILSTAVVAFISTFETYRYRLQATAMELKTKELERERALSSATQMRLASLQSRVHPHFLFNTINSISSLVHDNPEKAEDMLTRMAALLRFSLDAAQPGLVPLERELSIVKDYLEIEKARFSERLRYEISGGDGRGQGEILVPPLSIQTLVENSIKYAVNARREGALIRVVLTTSDDRCVVEVQDDGPGFGSLTLLPGHGLDNLEERLAMLFGEEARLHITSGKKETSVSFTVPRRGMRIFSARDHESITRVSG